MVHAGPTDEQGVSNTRKEDRASPRPRIKAEITVDNEISCGDLSNVNDLSPSGICVTTTDPIQPGRTVYIQLRLPEGQITLTGQTVWVRPAGQSRFEIGCQHQPDGAESRERLEELLGEYLMPDADALLAGPRGAPQGSNPSSGDVCMGDSDEKRGKPRRKVSVPAMMRDATGGVLATGILEDLSGSGARLTNVTGHLEPGTRGFVRLMNLSNALNTPKDAIDLEAEVVRSGIDGVALRFSCPTRELEELLEGAMGRRASIPTDDWP